MELFVLVSFAGVLVLLATHVGDYAGEVVRRRARAARISMPDGEVPVDFVPVSLEMENQYDRAA